MMTAPFLVPAQPVTLPITLTVGGQVCQAGTIIIEPADTHGSITRCLAQFLRDVAETVEGVSPE